MSWHVDQTAIERYQARHSDRVAGASLEAHMTGCEECRALVPVDRDWLEQSWIGVTELVMPGRRSFIERGLSAIGVAPAAARILALSPAFRLSFLLATALVMVFGVVASGASPEESRFSVFVTIAPLVPVVGVALAYSRDFDPLHELTLATPVDSFRLLLLRTAAVLGVGIGLGLLAWPLVPAQSSIGVAAWLLPGLGLAATTLALAARWHVGVVALIVGSSWLFTTFLAVQGAFSLFDSVVPLISGALCVASVAAIFLQRHHYDRQGGLS